jgi:hypothetical protein
MSALISNLCSKTETRFDMVRYCNFYKYINLLSASFVFVWIYFIIYWKIIQRLLFRLKMYCAATCDTIHDATIKLNLKPHSEEYLNKSRLTFWLRVASTSLTFNNCKFCPHCIYMLCKQRLVPLTVWTDWFYNRDEKCLQRGTEWAFK